ncbi:MAG: hypothetical protein ACI4KF_06000 [Huintestinicola sp.]
MKRSLSRFRAAVLFTVILTVLTCFASCSSEYTANHLLTSNTDKGWECTFGSLDGEYTNTFPINSDHLKISSSVGSGEMTVRVENARASKSFDGKNGEQTIDMTEFGEGTVYITLAAENAQDGYVTVVWIE